MPRREGQRKGRLAGVLFGLVFAGVGTAIFLLVAFPLARDTLAERGWPRVPARIVASSWDDGGGEEHPYRFRVRYRYRYGGRTYESTTYQRGDTGDDDFEPVQRLLLRYPRGAETTCRVNPRRPSEAILAPRPLWLLLLVPLPLLFVAMGLGVAAASLRGRRREALGDAATVRRRARGRRAAVFLGGIVTVAGLAAGAAMLPWLTGPIRARSWAPVRAVVVSSAVRRHESTDSEGRRNVTWKLDILYRYRWRGRIYHSNRYGFIGGSSSGSHGKREIARRYRPGRRVIAWVNPSDPAEAVLIRGYTLSHLLGLIPLGLLLGGAITLRWGLAGPRRAAAATPGLPVPGGAVPGAGAAAPRTLRPGKARLGKVAWLFVFVLFWNGITAVFAYQLVLGFRHGRPDWFLLIPVVPLTLVGLVLVGALLHAVLALANPRITVTLLDPEIRLGEPLRVAWTASGRVRRLRRLEIVLEGEERATYRRGTTTHTATHTFRTIPLATPATPAEMRAGEVRIAVPDDTMHSFQGRWNRIVWQVKVRGDVPRWPDVDDAWEVDVLPMRPEEV